MKILKKTVVTEMVVNEDETERYLYQQTWTKKKEPKLAVILAINPTNSDPNTLDLTTMLIANEVHAMKLDGFILCNLTSRIFSRRKIRSDDFNEENDSTIIQACIREDVAKIIVAAGSILKTNEAANEKVKELVAGLPDDVRSKVEIIVGKNGPIHPLSPEARSLGGWNLAKLKI